MKSTELTRNVSVSLHVKFFNSTMLNKIDIHKVTAYE